MRYFLLNHGYLSADSRFNNGYDLAIFTPIPDFYRNNVQLKICTIMSDLFYQGGPLFMGLLTLIFIAMIAISAINGMPVLKGNISDPQTAARKIGYIRSVGLFALIIGILAQLIGLFSAFQAIELKAVEVSPQIIAAGFKVSMITTIYGLIIFALSLLIWFVLSARLNKK